MKKRIFTSLALAIAFLSFSNFKTLADVSVTSYIQNTAGTTSSNIYDRDQSYPDVPKAQNTSVGPYSILWFKSLVNNSMKDLHMSFVPKPYQR